MSAIEEINEELRAVVEKKAGMPGALGAFVVEGEDTGLFDDDVPASELEIRQLTSTLAIHAVGMIGNGADPLEVMCGYCEYAVAVGVKLGRRGWEPQS